MRVFRLTPINLAHPDWKRSSHTHKDGCLVHAKDAESAREYAKREFDIAAERRPAREETPLPPWTNPDRVECKEIANFTPESNIEGLVWIRAGGEAVSREGVSGWQAVNAQDEGPRIICQECGHAFSVDEADTNEDDSISCPKCGTNPLPPTTTPIG